VRGALVGTLLVWSAIPLGASGCGRFGFETASDSGPFGGVEADAALPTMTLVRKTDAPDWTPLTGPNLGPPYGLLTWEPSGPTFRFQFEASGLPPGDYSLVQYVDPWPGNPATAIASATVDGTGSLDIPWSSYELNRDLTSTTGKVWLVPSAFIDPTANIMLTWDVTAILFELDFVVYDDTDVQ
jgi:hypothetical protein